MKLDEPPPNQPPERQAWPNWTRDETANQVMKVTVPLGIGITIFLHLFILWAVSRIDFNIIDKERPKKNEPIEVEFLPPIQPRPKFVETNPISNQEKPEETNNISSQDQVAAQEVPDPTQQNDSPRVEGEEMDSERIVKGDVFAEPATPVMTQPSEPALPTPMQEQPSPDQSPPLPDQSKGVQLDTPAQTPPTEQAMPSESEQESQPTEDASKPQFLDQETSENTPAIDDPKAVEVEEAPTEEEGFRAALKTGEAEVQVEDTAEQTAQPERGQEDRLEVYMEEVQVEAAERSSSSSAPAPQARPRLNFVRGTSGPLKNDPRSTSRVGTISVDANFDKFGAYLQRMYEAIEQQWIIIARSSSTITAEIGSRVVVQFTINQQGVITNLEVLYSSASRSGTVMCMEAIQSRAPFGVWTEEMARTLGEDEKITITFWYR